VVLQWAFRTLYMHIGFQLEILRLLGAIHFDKGIES
jgi:hypothetical protein